MPTPCANPVSAMIAATARSSSPSATNASSAMDGAADGHFAKILAQHSDKTAPTQAGDATTPPVDAALASANLASDQPAGDFAALIAAFLPQLPGLAATDANSAATAARGAHDGGGRDTKDGKEVATAEDSSSIVADVGNVVPALSAALTPAPSSTPNVTDPADMAQKTASLAAIVAASDDRQRQTATATAVATSAQSREQALASPGKPVGDDNEFAARTAAALSAASPNKLASLANETRDPVTQTGAPRGPADVAASSVLTAANASKPVVVPANESSDFAALLASRQQSDNTAATTAASAAAASAAALAVAGHEGHGGNEKGSVPTLNVDTPMGRSGWSSEVGDRLTWMVGRNEQRAELVLNPPQLGRIEVSLSVHDGQANAMFVSANPEVRDAISNAIPHLREALAEVGVSLGQAQVGTGSQGQSANPGENGDNWRGGPGTADVPAGTLTIPGGNPQRLAGGRGLVDVFA